MKVRNRIKPARQWGCPTCGHYGWLSPRRGRYRTNGGIRVYWPVEPRRLHWGITGRGPYARCDDPYHGPRRPWEPHVPKPQVEPYDGTNLHVPEVALKDKKRLKGRLQKHLQRKDKR